MDEFSNKKVDLTQRELTFIKAEEFDKGWRRGMIVAVANLSFFAIMKFF